MSVAASGTTHLRCHHCGSAVVETAHTRSSYRVGYYALHTGDVEPATIARGEDGAGFVTVLKLLRTSDFFTCADCYRKPEVRRQRERLFRPEQAVPAPE